MSLRRFVWLNFLMCPLFAFTQFEAPELISQDPVREKTLLEQLSKRYELDISNLSGEHKKDLSKIFKDRYEQIKTMLHADEIITEASAFSYLNHLMDIIAKANPQIERSELRVVFSREWIPNASSMGEGTILFNIGLFHRMENEAQVIFVLCHELAHYILDHGNQNILNYVNTVNSKEFKEKLKAIKKSEYRQNQQFSELTTDLIFKTRRHDRKHEEAADSLALVFMRNTGYDLNGALECLEILDVSEKDKYDSKIDISSRFNFPSYPFKKRWIESDVLMFANEEEDEDDRALADSLKTHPDCQIRIERLKNVVEKENQPGNRKFIADEKLFRQLKEQFDYVILEYCFKSNVSKTLYFALQMLNTYPDNVYLYTLAGRCLNEIYTKQKSHELGTIVELPKPFHKKDYKDLLQLIQNLRLSELAAVSFYFLDREYQRFSKIVEFALEWEKAKSNYKN